MRTTVAIDDRLLARAKEHAARSGKTLGQYIEDSLRLHMTTPASSKTSPPLPVFTRGTGAQPGVDLHSNRGLFDALDDAGDQT